jgi:hypothetical protein
VVLATLGGLAACSPPVGGDVVGLGETKGEITALAPIVDYYDGTSGEGLLIGALISHLPGTALGSVKVEAPDHTTVTSFTVPSADEGNQVIATLPATGRYTIVVRQGSGNLGVGTFGLLLIELDDHGPLPLGTTLPTPPPDHYFTYSYAGTAGERLAPGAVDVYHTAFVNAPDGSTLTPDTDGSQWIKFGEITLPVDGEYEVFDTFGGAALSHDLVGGALTLDSPVAVPPLALGQRALYTYDGTAGETVKLDLGTDNFVVLNPGGFVISGGYGTSPLTVTLPATATYTVLIEAQPSHDISVTHP